ncbi:MAG TPA: ATP-binding protein [Candidatus Saccharimonadales bacterium]|nr:ATP-binding protein [Candidatus Saccharimonadales bacterium]
MKLSVKIGSLIALFTLLVVSLSGGVAYWLGDSEKPVFAGVAAVALVMIVVLTAGIVWMLVRQITRPIEALNTAIGRIALGDLSQEVPIHSNDELGGLSRHFSEMTRQLSHSYRSLEATTEEARERRAELEASINSLRQGFILTDTKLNILMANAAANTIILGGKTVSKNPATMAFADIEHTLPDSLDLAAKVKQTLQDGKLAKYPSLPLDGRFLSLYISPVFSGDRAIGCVLLVEDITEERIIARSRDEFFSIASHELRTPLTAIRGNTSIIQQYFPNVMKDPAVKDMISDIHESVVRLIEIVNDFLDASSLEQSKMKFQPVAFPVGPVIQKVIHEMAELTQNKQVTVSVAGIDAKLPDMFADPNRVTQVVYNLIGNAVKFTDHGTVTVQCEKRGKHIKVSVSDTGLGISPEGQQILFHKFQQSAASILTRDNTRGTGLGLYISKLMVERMGGEIQLERSELGKGSTFSFTLPVATPAQSKAAAHTLAAPAADSK